MGFPGKLRALHSWVLLKSPGEAGASLPLLFLHNANLYDRGDCMWHSCIRWHCFSWCGCMNVLCYLAPERCGSGGINTSALWVLLFLGCGVLTMASLAFSIRWFADAVMKVSIFFFSPSVPQYPESLSQEHISLFFILLELYPLSFLHSTLFLLLSAMLSFSPLADFSTVNFH